MPDYAIVAAGNYTLDDNGVSGDGTSVLRNGNGEVILTLVNPPDFLNIRANVAGVHLTINTLDSFGGATLTFGNLTDAGQSFESIVVSRLQSTGAVTLVSNTTITEGGSDPGADIQAGSLTLSAQTGIATGANALETQVSAIEAETVTGGIAIVNSGSVQIGGNSAEVEGLDVATSGDISFTATGSIFLSDATGPEIVHGGTASGNVTLVASGVAADIVANTDNDAISAPGGNISLQAGRDIAFGTIGTDFDNDVRARGSLTVNAGRDFLVDGFSDMASDDFGAGSGGNVIINVGRNLHIRNVAGTDGSITAGGSAGADVFITTGAGGALILDAPTSNALQSNSGDVTVNADRMLIAATSGITANSGEVALRPATSGRGMTLGSGTDAAAAVELSDAELDRIFSPGLTLGTDSTGGIYVSAALSPANLMALALRTGESMTLAAGITTPLALSLFAGGNVQQNLGELNTGTLLIQVDTLGNDGDFIVLSGTVAAATVTLNGNAAGDYLSGAEGTEQTVHGFGGNDIIISSGEGHYFGDEGDDTMYAGLTSSVAEVMDGGAGTDTLDTRDFNGTYTINLMTGATSFGESFVNFENLTTGNGADTIIGNTAANIIITNGGADAVNAWIGNDTIRGGTGNDMLDGSYGFDTAVFSGSAASYNWTNTGQTTQITGTDGTDTLFEVERMQFDNATYQYTSTGYNAPALFTAAFGASAAAGGWSSNRTYPRLAADVDGNGLPDLVGFGSGGVYIALTQSNGTPGTPYLAYPFFGSSAGAGGWTDNQVFPRTLADINGDGRADLVGFGSSGVYAALATGGGNFGAMFLAEAGYGTDVAAGGWSSNRLYPRSLADVNGDGRADIVGFGDGGVLVSLATGGGQFADAFLATNEFGAGVSAGGWNDDDVYTRTLADINADGRADIVGFGSSGVYTAFAREDGTFNPATFGFAGFGASASAGGWTSNNLYYRTVADIHGDGFVDLIGFGDGGVYAAYGDGNGGFTSGGVVVAGFGAGPSGGSWTSQELYPRMLADLNGDGAADIIGFGDGGVITASSHADWVLV